MNNKLAGIFKPISIAAALVLAGAAHAGGGHERMELDFSEQWTVFIRPELEHVDLTSYNQIPDELGGVGAAVASFTNGQFAIIEEQYREGTPVVLMNEFDAPADGAMQIGCGADWFFEFFANSKSIYSTLRYGNESIEYSIENHIFDIPVKKGRNLVAVLLRSGSQGWKFFYGKPPYRDFASEAPTLENFVRRVPEIYETSMFKKSEVRESLIRMLQNGIDVVDADTYGEYARRYLGSEAEKLEVSEEAKPLLHFYEASFDKVLSELETEKAPDGGLVLWHIYNMGYIVKSGNGCFGIDIHHRRAELLAPYLDFLLITHAHGDHYTMPLVTKMNELDKPVVSNFLPQRSQAEHPAQFTFGEITVKTRSVDHNASLKNYVLTYEIICGKDEGACVIFHTGDASSIQQLAPDGSIDLYIVHPHVGVDAAKAVEVLKPQLTLVSHLQELHHPRGNARWDYVYAAHETLRIRGRGANAVFPLWGEKIVWKRKVIAGNTDSPQ